MTVERREQTAQTPTLGQIIPANPEDIEYGR